MICLAFSPHYVSISPHQATSAFGETSVFSEISLCDEILLKFLTTLFLLKTPQKMKKSSKSSEKFCQKIRPIFTTFFVKIFGEISTKN